MNVIKTAQGGIVNHETIFRFRQDMSSVLAEYAGGKVRTGYLVGKLTDNILKFTYCQLRITGELDHGESECILSKDKVSGKLKLEENFSMSTDGTKEIGTNILMEI